MEPCNLSFQFSSEKDPQSALSFLQALPAADQSPTLYSPIFSGWASADPATAGQRALQLPAWVDPRHGPASGWLEMV